jgi:hypothetical protein
MATHKVITTDAEIDQALGQAKQLGEELRAVSVEYKPGRELDLIILRLSDSSRRLIPREDIEGLQEATRTQIANVELAGNGQGLHWPDLDLDLYVPALLKNIYGSRRWMAQIGRRGGAAKSPAKRQAARENGLKGGRPKLAVAHG